jgi:hypothetical protein
MSAFTHVTGKDHLLLVGVELGVADTSTARSHLYIPSFHSLDIAHAVLVTQLTRDDV